MKQPLFSIIFHPRIFSHFLCHKRSSSWSWVEPCIGELGRTLQDRLFFFYYFSMDLPLVMNGNIIYNDWYKVYDFIGTRFMIFPCYSHFFFPMISTRFMISLGISQWFQPGFNQLFQCIWWFPRNPGWWVGGLYYPYYHFFSMGDFPIERWEKWESQSFPEWESWEYNG